MNELYYPDSPGHAAVSFLAWLYLRFTGFTSRIRIKGRQNHPGPAIYALWHNQEAQLIYLYRGTGLCGLVSRSKDGEYIARVMMRLGLRVIRGSTSSGGMLALRSLVKAARAGFSVGITPDGPRGPVYKAQPGAVYVAQKAGIPIIPAACALSRKLELGSWDRYQLPLPFGRMQAVCGEPLPVAEGDDLGQKSAELERRLKELTAEAEELLKRW